MTSRSQAEFQLHLPADLAGRRIPVLVNGIEVTLQATAWLALLLLVIQRWSSRNGNLSWQDIDEDRGRAHQAICRLRRDLGQALGKGIAENFIEHRGRSVYRLALTPDQISIDPELPDLLRDIAPELIASVRNCLVQQSGDGKAITHAVAEPTH